MRCTKCGFVSFDYHSECRKCGTSLALAREQLGFSSAKPGVPFLLGALLREQEPGAAEEKPVTATDVSPAFDFGDELGEGFRQVDEFSLAPGAAIPNPDEGEEDYSLLDLSDEELELLIDKEPADAADKRSGLWMDLDSEKKPSEPLSHGSAAEHPAPTESSDPDRLGDLIPRFDLDSLPGLAEKTPPPDAPPEPEFVWAEPEEKPMTPPAPPEEAVTPPEQVEASSEEAADQPNAGTDDFVIELSDSDLENLLMELDTSQKKEDQEEKETIPPGPKSKE